MRVAVIAMLALVLCETCFDSEGCCQEADLSEFLQASQRVMVSVSGDASLRNDIESHIKRELQAFGDVIVTDDVEQLDWEIRIVAIKIHGQAGDVLGVAISHIINAPVRQHIETFFKSLEPRHKDFLATLVWPADHQVRVGSIDDLEQMCGDMVAEFDAEFLDKHRQTYQTHQEIMDLLRQE